MSLDAEPPPEAAEAPDASETPDAPEPPDEPWFGRIRTRAWDFLESRDGLPFTALAVLTLAWIFKFGQLVIWQQDRYGSRDFDTGIFDQAAWLSAHGLQFDTVRGLPLYGHHATFGFYLFAPLYRLGFDGPTVENIAQVLALGLGAPVAYWVARRLSLDPWIAFVGGAVYLGHFSTGWLAQELFHPEVFAIAPLLAAFGFALKNQNKWYWAMLLFAIIWKEDVALAIVGLGLVFWFRRDRKRALQTIAFGALWFVLATQVLLPVFSPTGTAFYAQGFYGDLGDNFTEVAWSTVKDPSVAKEHIENADGLGYMRDLFTPFGFVNLLAPTTLFVMAPQLAANLLSVQGFTWSLRFHYVAIPLAASTLGFLLGLARLKRPPWRAFACGVAIAATISSGVLWGVAPYSKHYNQGYWPLRPHSDQAALDKAVSLVPGNAVVSASYHMVPHLSSRERIYSFPNPWEPSNWGINDLDTHDPKTIEWLVIMPADLRPEQVGLLDGILEDENFDVVFRRPGVLVARRR